MKTSRYNILLVLWALMLLVACSDSSSDESESRQRYCDRKCRKE